MATNVTDTSEASRAGALVHDASHDASHDTWTPYNFAVVRVVPHVYVGTFHPVGVVVHVRTAELLRMRVLTDPDRLRACLPDIDLDVLVRYLHILQSIAHGDASAGPLALLPSSERFHWLTAPRSDVLQSSAVHEGLCRDPLRALDGLFATYVEGLTSP